MCRILAGQPRSSYRQVTRSIRLRGQSTSVRLEAKLRETVDEIATARDMTTARFPARVHDEVEEIHGETAKWRASPRCCACLLYLQGSRSTIGAARSELSGQTLWSRGGDGDGVADQHPPFTRWR